MSENRIRIALIGLLCLGGWLAPSARAGLTFQVHISRFDANGTNYYYTIDGAQMTTNSDPSNPPFGDYFLVSPGYPGSHGTEATFHYDSTNGFGVTGGGSDFYGDFASMLNGVTNGNWTLFITNLAGNSVSTYSFAVSAPAITSNDIPDVFVTFPTNGAAGINNMPTFTWVGGSASYDGEDIKLTSANDNSFYQEVLTAVSVTSWQFPLVTVPPGTYNFSIDYNVMTNSLMVASTPTNGLGQPISSWVSTAKLDTSFQSQFTVPQPPLPTSPQGHALVLHYTWDGAFEDANSASVDVSGNGNNSSYGAGGGPNGGVTLTNSAIEGGQAVHFHDPDGVSLGALGVLGPSSVLDALAGSFTVSCWIRTTNHFGNDGDFAFYGAGIVAADNSGLHNDVVPLALTGSKIGFNTGGNSDQTINSTASVNDGNYHLVTVTRDQPTGIKAIYIDGVLDTTGSGTTNLLNDPQMVCFGSQIDATTDNLSFAAFHNGFDGDMDDLQIYSGVLSAAEVAYLFHNPGTPAPNLSGNGLVAHYAFDETYNIGLDTSGNEFNLDYNGGDGVTQTSDAKAGGNAAFFDGGSYLTYSTAPTNVLAAFAGDFTLALWVKTSQISGNDGDPAWEDAGIVAADIPNQYNDIIPMALTGGQIGCMTGGDSDDTINSTVDINQGDQYHQVVVTRNQATGEKQIYIDGLLNKSDFATTNLLNDPVNIGIGSGIDASQTDPSQLSNDQFYDGQLDDIQLYSRVLSASNIAFLFNHPGQTAPSNTAPPVFSGTVTLNFNVVRGQDPVFGDICLLFPGINVDPAPITTDLISSPNGYFNGSTSDGSGSAILSSLSDLLAECTNGQWTLTINQSNDAEQVFHFTVASFGLTTNVLTQITILVPTNGAVNVPTNTPFQWTGGPAGFDSLNISKQLVSGSDRVTLAPALNATNWPSPPALDPGANQFDVDYALANVTNFTFSLPVDAATNSITNFVTQVDLTVSATSIFTVISGAAPVELIGTQINGTSFQFTFLSQSGFTNRVQYNTNLASTNWLTYTNLPGDGSVKILQVPLSIFGSSKKGFVRIHP